MKMKKISVIIPVYNVEMYLKDCIESILKQTYREKEIILIDDGSTDKSGEICDIYAQKYKQIKVIHKKNEGASKARNVGLDIAKGEYISFIDSDDIIEIKMYEKMINKLEEYNLDIVCCLVKVCNEKSYKVIGNITQNEILTRKEGLLDFLSDCNMGEGACNKIYRKEILEKIKFDENYTNNEDKLFVFNVLKTVDKIGMIPEALYNYIKHSESSTTKAIDDKYIKIIEVNEKIMQEIKEENLKIFAERNVFIANIQVIRKIVFDNKIEEYKIDYNKSVKYIKDSNIDSKYLKWHYKVDRVILRYLEPLYPLFIRIIFYIFKNL